MAVITPSIAALKPQLQTRTLESGTARTILSEKDTNSQLLDTFLKSRRESPFTHLATEKPIRSNTANITLVTLPLKIIKNILRNLLTSPHPVILHPDPVTTRQNYRTHIEPDVLQVCKVLYNVGVPILYGENRLTTSSPATSVDFDAHLESLPGGKRQMIRDVVLEIDWADGLWARFPLVARALGELKGLRGLELWIVEGGGEVEREEIRIERDVGLRIQIMYGQCSPGDGNGMVRHRHHHPCRPVTDRIDWRRKREGPLADAMLKAEMRMLEDLVGGIKGLRWFRLVGYRDRVFAEWLEECVRVRRHRC